MVEYSVCFSVVNWVAQMEYYLEYEKDDSTVVWTGGKACYSAGVMVSKMAACWDNATVVE